MMSLTFGLFNQVSGLGPLGPLVYVYIKKFSFQNMEESNQSAKEV